MRPLTRVRIVLGVDPDTGDHQLRYQHHDRCREAETREYRDDPIVGFSFLFIFGLFIFHGGHFWLRESGAWCGGGFDRDGGLWEYGYGVCRFGRAAGG